jgi:hypothetical protein
MLQLRCTLAMLLTSATERDPSWGLRALLRGGKGCCCSSCAVRAGAAALCKTSLGVLLL